MDYELKIRQLEEETRHYRAMQALHDKRLDSHDAILTRIENQQVAIQASMRDLEGIVGNLAKTVDEFIRSLGASGRANGKS